MPVLLLVALAQTPKMPEELKGIPLLELQWKANHGDPLAMVDLAWKYHRGEGTPRDVTRAVKLFRQAAQMGNAEAKFQLGLCYGVGDGVSRDPVQARRWVDEAARQDHPGAMWILGTYYETGFGVAGKGPQFGIAFEWFKRAADFGLIPAMQKVGRYYLEGKMGYKDRVQGCIWLRLASERQGGGVTQEVTRLEAKMTSVERSRILEQVSALKAKWPAKEPAETH